MLSLQHNKTIVVDGPQVQKVVCGSTNFSWRGSLVQSNNAMILQGAGAVQPFRAAFENYWSQKPKDSGATASAQWCDLGLTGIDARVAFSPHNSSNALLQTIADEVEKKTTSCLFFSLAFLYQTPGPIRDAISKVSQDNGIFVYGISDRKVGGLELQKPDGNVAPVYPAALAENFPAVLPGATGGGGIRMHHKFIVVDFDKPSARVFSAPTPFVPGGHQEWGKPPADSRPPRPSRTPWSASASLTTTTSEWGQQEAEKGREGIGGGQAATQPARKALGGMKTTRMHKIRDRGTLPLSKETLMNRTCVVTIVVRLIAGGAGPAGAGLGKRRPRRRIGCQCGCR